MAKKARKKWMSPAEYVLFIFGGPAKLASQIGVHRTTPTRWPMAAAAKGNDGLIPSNKQRRILELGKRQGKDLTAEDLIYGRMLPLNGDRPATPP